MTRKFYDSQGVPINGYDSGTYPATSEADYDQCVAAPADWAEPPAPPPTADDLEGTCPWTFEQIEGVVGDAKRAYYEHDYMREMMHYELMRAGA